MKLFEDFFKKNIYLPLDKKIRLGYVVVKSGMKMFRSGMRGDEIPLTL
jgi:hypothetical protein